MQISGVHCPIKLSKICVSAMKSILIFHQSSGTNGLTEGLNIVRCTFVISVKGNEGKISWRNLETQFLSTVSLVQCHCHV
jgi:hypothetical protein